MIRKVDNVSKASIFNVQHMSTFKLYGLERDFRDVDDFRTCNLATLMSNICMLVTYVVIWYKIQQEKNTKLIQALESFKNYVDKI